MSHNVQRAELSMFVSCMCVNERHWLAPFHSHPRLYRITPLASEQQAAFDHGRHLGLLGMAAVGVVLFQNKMLRFMYNLIWFEDGAMAAFCYDLWLLSTSLYFFAATATVSKLAAGGWVCHAHVVHIWLFYPRGCRCGAGCMCEE